MDRASHSLWNAKDVARLLALVENERRYFAEITSDLPIPVAIVSANHELLLTNRAFQLLFHLKRAHAASTKLGELEGGAALVQRVNAAFASNQPADRVEAGARTISVTPFHAAEEPGQEVLLVVHSNGALAAAAEEEPEYDAIFWRRGPQLQFLAVSHQVEEMLGYTPKDYLTDPGFWLSTLHAADRESAEGFYRGITQDGRYQLEYRACDSRGNLLRLRDVIRVRSGRMSGITLDVTHGALLASDQLQAEKFEALSRMARRVTHDFNNLHMVIQGYGDEVLNALPAEGSSHGDMEEILGAAGRLAAAVEKLDIYIRRPNLQLAAFDLEQVTERMSGRLQSTPGVELKWNLDPAAAPVLGDEQNLGKIVAWLLSLDAGGQVRISTSQLSAAELHADKPPALKPGRYSVLEITNCGAALDVVGLEALLLRAHTVLRGMGGSFEYQPDARGNRFRLYVPSAPAGWKQGPEAAPAAPAEALRRVLVVEDEPGIRALIRKMLMRRGYEVLEAATGSEGLRMVNQHGGKIDLLITDLMMPEMNGRELVDRLALSWPRVRVVFISGFTDDPLLDRSTLPAGVVFLQKPFTLESLLETVDQALA